MIVKLNKNNIVFIRMVDQITICHRTSTQLLPIYCPDLKIPSFPSSFLGCLAIIYVVILITVKYFVVDFEPGEIKTK